MAKKKLLKPTDIPAFVVVLGTQIPVKLERIPVQDHEEFAYGLYDAETQTITIDPRHPQDARLLQDTLVHEVTHCIFHLSGISGLTDPHPNLEEALVRAITSGLAKAIDLAKLGPQVSSQIVEELVKGDEK